MGASLLANSAFDLIVPTRSKGMPPVTLRVTFHRRNAERPRMRSHAERGNDLTFDCDQMWERACSRIALLILLAA
ncbi:hypothetical protein E1508_26380 [Pseudomonas moraviensis]|nr:hypothetical protein E1508_26380 [Pseudomonas moraviensis]